VGPNHNVEKKTLINATVDSDSREFVKREKKGIPRKRERESPHGPRKESNHVVRGSTEGLPQRKKESPP